MKLCSHLSELQSFSTPIYRTITREHIQSHKQPIGRLWRARRTWREMRSERSWVHIVLSLEGHAEAEDVII